MRVLNIAGRLWIEDGRGFVDVAEASGGGFGADPQAVFDRWAEFRAWAGSVRPAGRATRPAGPLGSPVPHPRQVFAVGFNYADHADELGGALPARPVVFPKLSACVSGPGSFVRLSGSRVDWEVELVAVIGAHAREVIAANAWDVVAGLAVGQDLSDRGEQFAGDTPQFSLAKSFPGFGCIGPWMVTPDDLADPDDLAISCSLNGETVQSSRTGRLIFGVGHLIEFLSMRVPLFPGDVIFTGTPSGIGLTRQPPRFLTPDDVLTGTIEGIGELVTRFQTTPAGGAG